MQRLTGGVGRRGRALLAFAALDTVYAVRLATVRPTEQTFYTWLHECAPLWAWSLPWAATAVLCFVGAFQLHDKAGFAAAIGIKVLWSSLYLSGWLLGSVHEGWVSAAVWATFGVCVWLIAGWPEPVNARGSATWTPPLE